MAKLVINGQKAEVPIKLTIRTKVSVEYAVKVSVQDGTLNAKILPISETPEMQALLKDLCELFRKHSLAGEVDMEVEK